MSQSEGEGEGEAEDDPEADLVRLESPEAEPESPEAVSPLEQPGQAHAHEEDSKQLETDPEVNIFFVQLFRVFSGIEIGNF